MCCDRALEGELGLGWGKDNMASWDILGNIDVISEQD